jgi:hypothetical protein
MGKNLPSLQQPEQVDKHLIADAMKSTEGGGWDE